MVPGWMQILLVVLLIVLLFGRGKISEFMGDLAKGIKSFKDGISEDDKDEGRTIEHAAEEPVKQTTTAATSDETNRAS